MPLCPSCKIEMVNRKGKWGSFWGCPNFTSGCKQVIPIKATKQNFRREITRPHSLNLCDFTPSREQKEVGELFLRQVKNLIAKKPTNSIIVPSVPGSGKTYQLTYLGASVAQLVAKHKLNLLYACFNTNIRETLEGKIPETVGDVLSVNQLGHRACTNSWRSKFDDNKLANILNEYNREQSEEDKLPRGWFGAVKRTVELLKMNLLADTQENIEYCLGRYSIDVPPSGEFVALVQHVFARSNNVHIIDYTDQYYFPAKLTANFAKRYHIILGDEVQDWSKAQIECVRKALLPGGFFVLVGDPNQAIYSWRGADPDAMPRMKEELAADELHLTVCRRCPQSNVALAARLVPHIKPLENAPRGKIADMKDDAALDYMKKKAGTRTLLLCRKNAPLAKWCLLLLRNGVRAIIRGRDIGMNLLIHIERHSDRCKNLSQLLEAIEQWRQIEVEKFMGMGERGAARMESLNDQCQTLETLSEGLTEISQLEQRINTLFSDNDKDSIVHCSTIYKAKGDEAPVVVIVGPDDFSKVWGNDEVASVERRNICFVLITRTVFSSDDEGTTIFVNGRPKDFE